MAKLTPGDLLQFATSLNFWYVSCTVLSVTLSQVVGLSSSVIATMGKKLTYGGTIIAASIAELGIRHTKGPSGLGKTL